MGAGASAQLSPEEQAKYDELRALSPEAQQALAAAAMLDVLTAAAAHACAEGGKPETWAPGADGWLASAGDDRTVRLWKLREAK